MKLKSVAVTTLCATISSAAVAASLDISAHDIGGQVSSAAGPEAGVWVIAQTSDLPTKYAKVVVTDAEGRFVIPELPSANYKVWVRGYGLKDSIQVDTSPGKVIDVKTTVATPQEDAQNYPGMYWYSMLDIPRPEEFPGTGDSGNRMPPSMKSQAQWVDTVKNMCQSCHALGSRGIREIPKVFLEANNSRDAWAVRTQAGQAQEYMVTVLNSMGPDKVYDLFSKWTDKIADGALPFDRPERPKGLERNVVYTMWDWAAPTRYQHDAISTDKRNPRVNANGLIYGSSEESSDLVPTLDPIRNVASTIKHPYLDPKTPSSTDAPRGTSAYWGDEAIWDGHTSIHNVMMDELGKVCVHGSLAAA